MNKRKAPENGGFLYNKELYNRAKAFQNPISSDYLQIL